MTRKPAPHETVTTIPERHPLAKHAAHDDTPEGRALARAAERLGLHQRGNNSHPAGDYLERGALPSLNADGNLMGEAKRGGITDYDAPRPLWGLVARAMSSAPGGISMECYRLMPGMSADEAFANVAGWMAEYCDRQRRVYEQLAAAEKELAELKAQRAAVRAWLGTGGE
jgi:hypothetical protein